MDPAAAFTWIDGERLIRYGPGVLEEAPGLLAERGFESFALLTTERAAGDAAALAAAADVVLHVPSGPVPEAAAAVRDGVGGRPLVALGGGRVVDAAKAIGGADGLPVAALPTTLSGAEFTGFHRMPAGVEEFTLVRPSVVVCDPALMASQPMPGIAASAMNAMAHAVEALYSPLTNPGAELCGLASIGRLADALGHAEPDRSGLALGALLAGWATGSAGYGFIHVICQTVVRVTGAPHAQTYAVMLPHGLELVVAREPELAEQLNAALGGPAADRAAALAERSGATALSALGVGADQLPEIAAAAAERAEIDRIPGPALSSDELRRLLGAAL